MSSERVVYVSLPSISWFWRTRHNHQSANRIHRFTTLWELCTPRQGRKQRST